MRQKRISPERAAGTLAFGCRAGQKSVGFRLPQGGSCKAAVLICLVLLLLPAQAFSQDAAPAEELPGSGALPRQFRALSLGMPLDDLKTALLKDSLFGFRGDRDVSFLPLREQTLIETAGASFVRRAFFQLRDGKLFIMAFSLNTETVDHYSVFSGFVKKYGEPSYLDPKEAVWETEDTRIAVERPLTVKYIDKKVFDDLINESALNESFQVRQRQDFLNDF